MSEQVCELCREEGGELLWRDGFLRVVLAPEPDYPGFCRVVLNRHVREMTELPPVERIRLMAAVFSVEQAVRECLSPDKINLASLGNVVPHLHWHVIPRFRDDRHFPAPVWATPAKERATVHAADTQLLATRIASLLAA
ncbi:MAG TPA: HIT family protein [Burkholderiales bacterium]